MRNIRQLYNFEAYMSRDSNLLCWKEELLRQPVNDVKPMIC